MPTKATEKERRLAAAQIKLRLTTIVQALQWLIGGLNAAAEFEPVKVERLPGESNDADRG